MYRYVIITVLAMAVAQPASAQTSSRDAEARLMFEAGVRAYEAGDYEAALRRYQEAYDLSQRPALLFNIGTAHERLRNDREAADAYRRYLEAVPDAANREFVEGRIELLSRSAAATSEATPEGTATPDLTLHAADAPADEAARSSSAASSDDEGTAVTKKWWFWTIVGVVVVGASVGLAVGLRGGGGGSGDPVPGNFGGVVVTLGAAR
ncbi:MAG: hypothetical protein KC593_21215 [Myxococcales bacterium]|nr:hypothetical protein [Myxococcales bacterium]MCB9626992.1 hypothetical protein [Sandaracinaceae bacterium]